MLYEEEKEIDEDMTATEIAVDLAKENEQRKILSMLEKKGEEETKKYLESQLEK